MKKNSLPKNKNSQLQTNYMIMTRASIYKLIMYCYIVSHAYSTVPPPPHLV
jgi:hypothetical protein